MNRYETLLLVVPGITGDESGVLERNFEKLVQESKGTVVSFDKWGKCRLAYPVRHNDYGVYFLARFELDPSSDFFTKVGTMFTIKYNDVIMRSSTVKIQKGQFGNFRPDTVEEMPTRNVNDFLRENKMQGLIASDDDDMDNSDDEGIEA